MSSNSAWALHLCWEQEDHITYRLTVIMDMNRFLSNFVLLCQSENPVWLKTSSVSPADTNRKQRDSEVQQRDAEVTADISASYTPRYFEMSKGRWYFPKRAEDFSFKPHEIKLERDAVLTGVFVFRGREVGGLDSDIKHLSISSCWYFSSWMIKQMGTFTLLKPIFNLKKSYKYLI